MPIIHGGLQQLKVLFHFSYNFLKLLSHSDIINILNRYKKKKYVYKNITVVGDGVGLQMSYNLALSRSETDEEQVKIARLIKGMIDKGCT
ncbi:hypothetical protein MZD87_08600 [Pediococcus pentosaceus]|uniref:hypothetical protein n=1 Tax=Pediococcus pentosaceus TaxID=1255 RepID=UPI00384A9849|nr:hypothetical protein [Pediococcus pentosaceus]